ncbi:MAG: ABC transporter permease [Candidatus Promineifilaceae bacterium]
MSQSKPRLARAPAGWRDPWLLASLPLLLFLIIPLASLFLSASPAELIANLSRPQVFQAIRISLLTTLASTAAIVTFGTPLAYALARGRAPLQRLLDALIELPIVLPPAVAGVALLLTFGRQGLIGGALDAIGLSLAFTPLAVIMAQTFVAAPFYIRSAVLGFEAVPAELELAAAIDGATSWQLFRHVTVPLAWASLLSGAVLSWARALGEFGATILFAGNFLGRTQTMPLAIYIGFELDLDVALTLATILVLVSFAVLWLVRGALSRPVGRPRAGTSRPN